jgi:ATP-dependent Lhr-like helicase
VVLETYRQALSDVFDLPGLKKVLTQIRGRQLRVHEVETPTASPFARSLVFAYVAAYIYEQDAPLAERRAQALTLDRALLAELLGQAELRELIDPDVLAALERELQHLDPDRAARDADELHDLLRRLGDLTEAELAERCTADAPIGDWLTRLADQRRATRVRIAGEPRWISAEDAGLYRDALGCVPPPGLPETFIAPTEAPLEQLLRRFARTHGPFPTREAATRLGLRPAQLGPILRLLEGHGQLVHGEIRPLGAEPEWCDPEVLRRLRRRTLARARDAVAPVDAATLGRFLPAWHGIGEGRRGPDRLLEAVLQLEGLTLSWTQLERVLLPARVPGYRPEDLDLLAATGQLVWVGRGASGAKDGRIALYRRESIALLASASDQEEPEANAEADDLISRLRQVLLTHLQCRGACFLVELMQAAEQAGIRAKAQEVETALWDLVWDGRITNDTFAPLRGLAGGARRQPRGRMPAIAGGRWSLVGDLVGGAFSRDQTPDRFGNGTATASYSHMDTERLLAQARMLLERYGVVSREAVAAEGLRGGFGPIYRVLKQMEEAGQVRRGWFVDGLSGAQFAAAGVVDRLRAERVDEPPLDGFTEDQVRILAAADPANPYGALLPWPATNAGGQSPKRVAGAWLILVAGQPVLYVGAGRRQLTSFAAEPNNSLDLALEALHRLPTDGRRRLLIQQIDGQPALESPLREPLLAAGFETDYDALTPARSTRGGIGRDPNALACA